ncbi:MAG TPA: condensation domain-containing protein, partial [Symbiobacteriaceae bacterium]|nr:condensation domain-containing protein [Symbiobacteriaceae bacterium]
YWKEQLAGVPVLDLPTDFPRPPVQSFRGGRHSLTLDPGLVDRLGALARQEGATLFMVLLSAWQMLLARYAGQADVAVGTPVANRARPELETLIGFFANTLVLRTRVEAEPSFRQLLRRVRELTVAAFSHQELPFDKLVEELSPDRNPGYNPLFQVMFVLQNAPLPALHLPDLQLSAQHVDNETAMFDLLLNLTEGAAGFEATLVFGTDLFRPETAAAMLEHYALLLRSVCDAPDRTVGDLQALVPVQQLPVAIAATFTADPIREPLSFLLQEAGVPSRLRLAPYNQVFQQLLDPASLLATNTDGVNLILLRVEDLGDRPENLTDFVDALAAFRSVSPAPCLLCLCPPSDPAAALPELNVPGLLHYGEVLELWPVRQVNDPYTDALGHVPYSPAFFAALAAAIVRRLAGLANHPCEAVLLDCDDTLWTGVAGEDGPEAVAPVDTVQTFLLNLRHQGARLALCSQNAADDVLAVFRSHPAMPLKLQHLADWQVGWDPLARSMALVTARLGVSLEQCVY